MSISLLINSLFMTNLIIVSIVYRKKVLHRMSHVRVQRTRDMPEAECDQPSTDRADQRWVIKQSAIEN